MISNYFTVDFNPPLLLNKIVEIKSYRFENQLNDSIQTYLKNLIPWIVNHSFAQI